MGFQPRKLVSCCISASSLVCIAYIFISVNVYFDERFSDSSLVLKEKPIPRKFFLSDLKVPSSLASNDLNNEIDLPALNANSDEVKSTAGQTVRPTENEGKV